jgi:hypothetical protein
MRHEAFPVWVFVIPLLFVALGYAIAFTRKGSVRTARLGARRLEIFSNSDPAALFAKLSTMRGKFTADDSDASAKIIVLASPVSFFSWGFLYPVFIHPHGSGSRVEVGIQSKFFQIGPVVGKWHRDCVAAIEQAVSLPEARVV